MYHCPACITYLFQLDYDEPAGKTSEHEMTPDEIRYAIHSLGKQLQKVENARKQLYSTIAKLEIMLEVAKEREAH
jgi:hypothetical protein